MSRIVNDAIDTNTGNPIYFKTHAKVVYASDGVSVNRHINKISSELQKFNIYCKPTQNELPNITQSFLTKNVMDDVFGNLQLNSKFV